MYSGWEESSSDERNKLSKPLISSDEVSHKGGDSDGGKSAYKTVLASEPIGKDGITMLLSSLKQHKKKKNNGLQKWMCWCENRHFLMCACEKKIDEYPEIIGSYA